MYLPYKPPHALHRLPLPTEPALRSVGSPLQDDIVHLQSAGEVVIRGRDELEFAFEVLRVGAVEGRWSIVLLQTSLEVFDEGILFFNVLSSEIVSSARPRL